VFWLPLLLPVLGRLLDSGLLAAFLQQEQRQILLQVYN